MSERDYNDPMYKNWRMAVKRRDKFRCRMCGSNKKLKVHHIKTWAEHPSLRFAMENGVTLCRWHHDVVTGHEEVYEALFMNLVGLPSYTNVLLKLLFQRHEDNKQEPL